MKSIKTAIEEFLSKTRVSSYRLAKVAGVSSNVIYNLLNGKRVLMFNRTEQKLREAMARLEGENV